MNLFTSLRYLCALHQHQHFGRAADACHITQPAFSNAIRALEQEFGTVIVKRGRSFESFTPEGERIFLSAQRMLREQELLLQELRSTREQPVGSVALGAVPSVMPIAARFAGHLHAAYPGLSLTVRSLSSQEIEAGLENLSLDLGLGYTERILGRSAVLDTVHQYTERYFFLRRASEPGRSSLHILDRPMSWAETARSPLCLLTPEMHNRSIVDASLRQAGVQSRAVIETNSILTLSLTVLVGDVCSILPGALVAVLRGYGELEALPLVTPDVMTPIGFMCHRSERRSNAMRVALALAKDPVWLAHVQAHVGLLQPGRVGDPAPG